MSLETKKVCLKKCSFKFYQFSVTQEEVMMSIMFYFYWIEVTLTEFVNLFSTDILLGFIGLDERERYNNRILNTDSTAKGQRFTDHSIRSSSFKQGLYNSKDHISSLTSPIDLRLNFYLRVSELQCLIFPFHMITFWFLSLQPQYLLFALNVLKQMVWYNRKSIPKRLSIVKK